MENNNENLNQVNDGDVKSTVFVPQEGTGKKALKWVIRGVVAAATFALGVITGKTLSKGSDEESTEEEKAE